MISLNLYPYVFTGYTLDYLYTKGKEFSLRGKEYVGEYHVVGSTIKTGPVETESSETLYPYYTNDDALAYDQSTIFDKHIPTNLIKFYTDPQMIQFSPTSTVYQKGYADRAFCAHLTNKKFPTIEIDPMLATATDPLKGPCINPGLYKIVKINWKLTGSKQSIQSHNFNELVKAAKQIPSIGYSLPNLLEFAHIK